MKEPRAYGIYKDESGNFIVYKNKSNGERSIRYKGSDEAYAVNEIYQKLRTEMAEQKLYQAENLHQSYQPNRNYSYDEWDYDWDDNDWDYDYDWDSGYSDWETDWQKLL